jgi:hypothetical protein
MMPKCITGLYFLLIFFQQFPQVAYGNESVLYSAIVNCNSFPVKSTYDLTTNRYEFLLSVGGDFVYNYSRSGDKVLIPIILTTTNLGNDDIVKLEWTASGAGELYHVMRDDGSGSGFTEIGVTYNLTFFDTISYPYCTYTTFSYRIESNAGNSNTEFESLTNFRPVDPVVKLVTVNNELAEIYWSPSESDAVSEYIIERNIPPWETYFTTTNTDTVYVDDNAGNFNYLSPCENVVIYTVRAKDLCGAESPGDNKLVPHNNILLSGNTSENCERKAALEWNAYNNMVPPATEYLIQKSFDSLTFNNVGTVSAGSSQAYEYIDQEMLEPFTRVFYRIAATNGELSSYSCTVTLFPVPDTISSFEITNVTVTDNSFITLYTYANLATIPEKVEISRTSNEGTMLFNTINWDPSGTLSFEDHDVMVNQSSYTYSAKVIDECDLTIFESNEFNSLLLTIGVDDNNNVSLDWNNHQGWDTELQHYLVYKYNDGVLESSYPVLVSAAQTTFEEIDDSDALQTTYIVEAVKYDGTASRSNEVLLPRDAEINVPTAFRPNSLVPENREFNPLLKNVDPGTYLFLIFNRWGQQVFETRNPLEGWDGSFKGEIQQGIYVYRISFRDQAGNELVKKGSVILVK